MTRYACLLVVAAATASAVRAQEPTFALKPIGDVTFTKDVQYGRSDTTTLNAPLTLLNHASGYHGFEMFNDDDATRDVMEQTISFVRRATTPSFQAAIIWRGADGRLAVHDCVRRVREVEGKGTWSA